MKEDYCQMTISKYQTVFQAIKLLHASKKHVGNTISLTVNQNARRPEITITLEENDTSCKIFWATIPLSNYY